MATYRLVEGMYVDVGFDGIRLINGVYVQGVGGGAVAEEPPIGFQTLDRQFGVNIASQFDGALQS